MLSSLLARLTASKEAITPPDPRREAPRVEVDARVEFDDQSLRVVNWSYRGFLADGYAGERSADDQVEVRFCVESEDRPFEFECQAKLIRVDRESQKVVASFVGMEAVTRVEIVRRFG